MLTYLYPAGIALDLPLQCASLPQYKGTSLHAHARAMDIRDVTPSCVVLRSCACKKRARTRGVAHGLRRFSQAPRLHLLCCENEYSCRGSRILLQDLFYKTLTWAGEKYNGLVHECF